MKIVDRKTFLAMPAGTVYAKYRPCYFEDLCIKGDSIGSNDWGYQSLFDAIESTGSSDFSDRLFRAEEFGESLPMDFDCQGRDGCFDGPEVKFAVWEEKDVLGLIARLQEALTTCKQH